jgi:DNA-binding protein HU-beta
MTSKTDREEGRVSKREFVSRVAKRAGVPVRIASHVYDSVIEEILDIVGNGNDLTLTGFGKFYPQMHKGHRVRVADANGKFSDAEGAEIDNYAVLKFSATRSVNKKVGATVIGLPKE